MPEPTPAPPPLSREALGHLAYLRRVLGGPALDSAIQNPQSKIQNWDGFYVPHADAMNFGLRFQLAFAAYAVAAGGLRTPAYARPTVAALGAAVERMLDVRAWGYWRRPAAGEGAAPAGHVAVLFGGPARAAGPLPPPADPVVQDNVQFSGHLGTMLGLYERAGGDDRYDRGFVLADPANRVAYPYTHGAVAARIVAQMRDNAFHGVACEPACAYVPCNNHAMTCNALHDATHGTAYAAANADWLDWVRRRMVLHGPAARGLFGACYLRDLHVTAPVAFQFTDGWGLAFLLPFDPALVRRLYPRFRRRLSKDPARRDAAGRPGLYVGSAPLCEKMEISDAALNTAFGLIVARGLGDTATAARLAAYAAIAFERRWDGPALVYAGAPRTLHTTALYTLAAILDGDPGLLPRLFHAPRDAALDAQPALDAVRAGGAGAGSADGAPDPASWADHLGIAVAFYDPAPHTLTLATEPLGDAPPPDVRLHLHCVRAPAVQAVTADGRAWDAWSHDPARRTLEIQAVPGRGQRFVVHFAA